MEDPIFQSISLSVLALGIVLVTFIVLILAVRVIRWADERLNSLRIAEYAQKVELHQIEDEMNDEIVAVITAAVAATLKKPVVVRKIRFLSAESEPAWAVTGRLNIMASHAVAKRKV
jgi:sodium pump decarboxylase gamma subunit